MNEAVLQSAGPRLETTQSPPWWQQTEEAMWRMGGITCNAEGFVGETGAVDVLEGGERDTNDLLSCFHYPLKGLAAGRVAGAIPHSDAASQDNLDGASVAQLDQFMNELLRDDCVECWTEVYEQHSDIRVFFVQICEGWVEGSGDGIIGRAVGPICKLEWVQGGGEDRLDVLHV